MSESARFHMDALSNHIEALAIERDEARALVRQHRSEFLGEIQGRIIELGGDPPEWPARNDIEAHDDVESAARMGMERAWSSVNALIRHGELSGNGCDETAQRNGLVLAANAIRAAANEP